MEFWGVIVLHNVVMLLNLTFILHHPIIQSYYYNFEKKCTKQLNTQTKPNSKNVAITLIILPIALSWYFYMYCIGATILLQIHNVYAIIFLYTSPPKIMNAAKNVFKGKIGIFEKYIMAFKPNHMKMMETSPQF